ncbi:hypothetical protein D3C80_868520 [compost metagenome]
MQQDCVFRFYDFRMTAARAWQGIAAIDQIVIQAQQGTVSGFTHKTTVAGRVLGRKAEIEKLYAAVRNQRDALFVVAKIYQHRIRHLLS